jgi:hypothetical protein
MLYPGHAEGVGETEAVEAFARELNWKAWRVFVHSPLNRALSPRLVTMFRIL